MTEQFNNTENAFTYGSGRSVKISQKDCMDFLRSLDDNSVDMIITDPAYSGMNNKLRFGKGRIVGSYAQKGEKNGKWFQEFEDTTKNYDAFLLECSRVLNRSHGHIYIMFDSFSLLTLGNLVRDRFNVKNIIVWDKVNIGMGHYFRRQHEFIIFATNGNNRNIKNRSFKDIWQIKRIHNASYPTQKPVQVFGEMLDASAIPGFLVCDPFMGAGSSAIASIEMDCNFIGCDVSERALQISSERIHTFISSNSDPFEPKRAVNIRNE